ncbi:replication factor A [Haloferax mucosum ATCC BAA-1512]|uniref:Replication factor A n=1 Tax=Haloferax mucosum ATCC BAA-1512 TaxID=662479 RepID=M0IH22_9EURY|nr:single-stranded DNA binding protein [Haloferax mucosum]ELZ94764.1 replication factor A [Haloferax mucosum ATCC BAA-1512]
MGVIEDVYDDLDTDVAFEEFEAAVNDKVEQMGGLADEETAAMLIAHELRDEEVNGIADIEPGMEDVKFLAKVVSIGELRTFERDDEDEDGRVINIEVADETGQIRVSLWDGMAAGAEENLEVGTVLRVAGRPKEGYNGVEVSASKVEEDLDADVDVQVLDTYRVEDLALGLSDVNLEGKILDTGTVRTFDRDDGSEGRVSNLSVGDPTGRIRVTLWDERADLAEELETGQSVEVVDGYVRERDGSLELHVGSRGAVEAIDETIEYVPETTDIGALELGQTVDIAGGVIESDGKRTFDRDDGSEGQVRNIRVKDDTGDIRVALWGEKADTDVDLADYVVITDVQIKDGWQDDLEASAGWRSSVTVMDDAPSDAGGTTDTDAASTSDHGLGAFSSDGSAPESSAGDDTAVESDASSTADSFESAGESVEFTGTVVQAGNPVILDDGSQTKTVETDADLGLGDEVTVNGTETDGRIDAETVEVHTGAQR